MKKFAIILALMVFGLQISSVAVAANSNYNKKPAQKKTQTTKPISQKTTKDPYKPDGSDYLLKYNINDLEAAPWLNGGNRKI